MQNAAVLTEPTLLHKLEQTISLNYISEIIFSNYAQPIRRHYL
jgi:hypothetical protein